MIGMYAERKPKGFGFSDTAFRIFILMASRRLESDRFFTRDYRPEVYTQEGLDWVESNSMRTLLLRHFPELEPALRGRREPVRAVAARRRGPFVTELAPGIHSLGHGEGRACPRLPDRRRRRAHARRHAVRGRRAARARGDPRARPQPERPEADRDHARPPLAPRRARGAEARERRHGLRARVGGRHRRRRPPRAGGDASCRSSRCGCSRSSSGCWLGRPKHAPCPVDELLDEGDAVRPATGASRRGPLAWPPRLLLAGAELPDRRRRGRDVARALPRLARVQPEQVAAPRERSSGWPRSTRASSASATANRSRGTRRTASTGSSPRDAAEAPSATSAAPSGTSRNSSREQRDDDDERERHDRGARGSRRRGSAPPKRARARTRRRSRPTSRARVRRSLQRPATSARSTTSPVDAITSSGRRGTLARRRRASQRGSAPPARAPRRASPSRPCRRSSSPSSARPRAPRSRRGRRGRSRPPQVRERHLRAAPAVTAIVATARPT